MNALKSKLTPDEAGRRLGVKRNQISIYIRKGYLKATNVGDGTLRPRWQIDQDDLDYFIANKDTIVPKKKRGGYHRKPKEATVKSEVTKVATEPVSYLDQKYVTDLLQENRDLRKKLEEALAKVSSVEEQLELMKAKNENLISDLEAEKATKDKMVEDIFGILANNE